MRKLKQALSLSLALVLSLALAVPAFADDWIYDYSANGYTDPTAENVEFSVAPIGVATIRWVSPWATREYTAYVFDQDCAVTRKDGLPFKYFGLQDGDMAYSVSMGVFEQWAHIEQEWAWVEAGSAGIRADSDYNWAFQFAPDYDEGGNPDWSPYMISKKSLDTVFPYEYEWEGERTTGTVLEYRTLSAQPTVPTQPEQPTGPAVSDWAKEQVSKAQSNNLIADRLGNDYRVNITRAQFAATAVKLYEAMSGQAAPAAGSSPFTDTSDSAVIQAEALGFVSGVGDGKFAPDSLVTREQAASMLSRVYTKLGGDIPVVSATTFADNSSVSDWARDSVAFMSDKGIVSGVGNNTFNPQGSASIEQALSIALRMFDNLK